MQILRLNLQFTPIFSGRCCACAKQQSRSEKFSCRESWNPALQCNIRHNCSKLEFCGICCFLLKIFSRIFGYWWTVVVSVGIPMDFFICFGIVNFFKLCILMIFVPWNLANISQSFLALIVHTCLLSSIYRFKWWVFHSRYDFFGKLCLIVYIYIWDMTLFLTSLYSEFFILYLFYM